MTFARETPGERNTRLYLKRVEDWQKEGRGCGEGRNYKPWLTVHDVRSRGLRVRVWCHKTNRVHHLLSKLEYYFFLIAEADPEVLDIREQFPIPIELSVAMSQSSTDMRHPGLPGGKKTRTVVTTDFVLTRRSATGVRYAARNIKYRSEHTKTSTVGKLALETAIWERTPPLGVPGEVDFGVFSEKEVIADHIRNLKWLRSAYRLGFLRGIENEVPKVESILAPLVATETDALANLTDYADEQLSLEPGSALAIVKWLIAHRLWIVDLEIKIVTTRPLRFEKSLYEHPNIGT